MNVGIQQILDDVAEAEVRSLSEKEVSEAYLEQFPGLFVACAREVILPVLEEARQTLRSNGYRTVGLQLRRGVPQVPAMGLTRVFLDPVEEWTGYLHEGSFDFTMRS